MLGVVAGPGVVVSSGRVVGASVLGVILILVRGWVELAVLLVSGGGVSVVVCPTSVVGLGVGVGVVAVEVVVGCLVVVVVGFPTVSF